MRPSIQLHHGDSRNHLKRLIAEGVRVHSVICDPPYGLVSIAKRFGKDDAAPAKFGTDGAFQRASGGFMNQQWDASGIERDPEFWRLVHDILLPGGYLVAFSSPRTGHRMACAIEDAGFIMHPFFGWTYGSGMPKGHSAEGQMLKAGMPADVAAEWAGWQYGAQALKPALEPIYIAQRPFDEKTGPKNFVAHGVGAINIDACRVAYESDADLAEALSKNPGRTDLASTNVYGNGRPQQLVNRDGRVPANLLHDGSPEVVAMFPVKAGGKAPVTGNEPSMGTSDNASTYSARNRVPSTFHGDAGSAARFFNSFPPTETGPLFYQAKAGTKDRVYQCTACELRFVGRKPDCGCVIDGKPAPVRCHPTVKPELLMRWLCRLYTPAGGTVLDPFAGSGTTGAAALAEGFNCILIEGQDEYAADIRARFDLDQPAPVLPDDIDALIGGAAAPSPSYEDLIG